jgi:hypothetical protein
MSWETLTCNDGIYLVDWAGLTRIIRSCKRAKAMNDRRFSEERTTRGERDWWALGMRLPDLHTVEVDWQGVNLETTTQTELELRNFYAGARRSMQGQLRNLVQMMEQADDDRDAFHDKQVEAQNKTQDNIEDCVGNAETAIKVLKEVRDTSGEIVMVGATYMSGGTASVVFTTVGSGMKGYFAYQDTGRADRAVATFSTNLLMGALDLKVGAATKALSTSEKIGIGIVWAKSKAVLDVPKSLIEGKNLRQAVGGAAVKMVFSTPGAAGVEGLKAALGEESEAWAIPVEVALNRFQDKLGDAAAEYGQKEEPKETKGPPAHLPPNHPNHRLMDAVIYDESIIEQTAVRQIGSLAA